MKKTKSVNDLIINTTNSERGGKFKNIMNSPNFGKQQIILQSCCFFDYDKCQTPKSQSTGINFPNSYKNKINSNRIMERSKNIITKNNSHMDLIKTKFDEMRKNEVDKLKNENKVLKDTINNLILQLDKTFKIAENVKNKEKNISQINTYKENEILNMKSKINSLILEKQQLLDKIKNQEKNYINHKRRYSWSNLQSPKFGNKKNVSFTDIRTNQYSDKNICLTESNNIDFDINNKYSTEWNNNLNKTLNYINTNFENNRNKILYDKRLNKRRYVFNKKKTSNSNREYPLMKSRNAFEKIDINNDTLKEKYKSLLKEKNELKISFNGLLNECDNSRTKYNTEELTFSNENSFLNSNTNNPKLKIDLSLYKNKISNLEKINYELNKKINKIENEENEKYNLLMNKYNKLFSEYNQIKNEFNMQIKIKESTLEEINNKYNNIMIEFNNKNSTFNNLKAKYDQVLRINNNNINIINNNRIKLNEAIEENNDLKIEIRKKTEEIEQKNIEIGRFKKVINDLNELKNIEKKLKQSQINNNEIENENQDKKLNSLLSEIEKYKSQINKLNKSKEELQKECDSLKKNNINKNNQVLIEEYENKLKLLKEENDKEIKMNKLLNEKNKKLEKSLAKANQELDQYEIESKEADIEIKSFKIKINELLEEIKKLKHKETIEEVNEENYEEEEDKK